MSFLSGAFLFGLLGIAVPLVIHLIHRQRYPERNFTTLRFFDKTIKHNVIQRRLIDKILLALRVLALIAIMVGLARPFLHTAGGTGGVGERRMSVVMVIDNSPSMARMRDGKTLLEHAKSVAGAVLADLTPADRAEVLLTSPADEPVFLQDKQAAADELELRAGQPTALLVGGKNGAELSVPALTSDSKVLAAALKKAPADAAVSVASYSNREMPNFGYDHGRLRRILDSAQVSSAAGNLRETLKTAAAMLRRSADGDRKIIVLSDLQASNWNGEPIEELKGLPVSIICTDPKGATGANIGIENVTLAQEDAGLGQDVTATATIRNYDAMPSGPVALSVVAGERGKPSEMKLPAIAGGTAVMVNFPVHVMGRERNLLCSATVKSQTDPFGYDDAWNFQIGVRPPVTTLCVNGAAGAQSADKQTFFIMNALASHGTGGAAGGAVDARECDIDELKDKQLFQYGVIVLSGVQQLDKDVREKLRQFVEDGRGLLIFPGARATPEEYNGWGLLPARVVEAKKQTFTYVKMISDQTPAVAGLKERLGSGIHALSTDTWLALEADDGANVLARLADGSPALVEKKIGKGHVILAAASAHASESDWPLRPAFVLLMRNLVDYLGAPTTSTTLAPNRVVGESAAMRIDAKASAWSPASFRLLSDRGSYKYQPLAFYRRGDALVLPAAEMAGHYVLSLRPGGAGTVDGMQGEQGGPGLGSRQVPISVNHATQESDLTPAAASDVAKLLPGALVTNKTLMGDAAAMVSDLRSGRDFWRWLLMAGLTVLLAESLVAWKWASGSAE